jgi:phosphoglycolate phosphatase
MSRITVDAFVYDLDGTLIEPRVDITAAVNAALAAAGRPPLGVERVVSFVGEGLRTLLVRAFGTRDPAVIDRAEAAYREHYRAHCLDHTHLYPGVLATLEHFRRKRHAVVSNKPADFSRAIVDGLGLGPHIPVVVGADAALALKPDPAPVRLALEQLGVQAGRAVMVGDGVTDIEAGRRAGLRTCAVTYGLGEGQALAAAHPDHLLARFDELRELFV